MRCTRRGRVARRGGLELARLEPVNQPKRCHLWVSDDRNAADIAVRRRDVHGSAETLDAVGSRVHIVDANVPHPPRRRAHFPCLLRQVHESAYRDPFRGEQGVGEIRCRRVLRAPAHDCLVEGLGARQVCRYQLVPDEPSTMIDHVGFSACVSVLVQTKDWHIDR